MKFFVWLAVASTFANWMNVTNGAPLELSIRYESDVPNQAPIVLIWETVPGRSYNLLAANTPNAESWATLNPTPLIAETSQYTYRDLNSLDNRFYRVVELSSTVVVNLVGISEQVWRASDMWVPETISRTVSGGDKTLITLGAWWDGSFPAMPTDASGVFTEAVRRSTNNTRWPVRVQVTYQANAASGLHEVKPQVLGDSGDGYFLLLEAAGLSGNELVRDKGYASDFRPSYPPPNPIQEITVSTEGTSARVGDLAVAIVVMDNTSNPDINITLPEGWTSLGYNDVVVDNIGYRACYKIVTTPGRQTVTCGWVDNNTFVAEAGIVVFRAAAND